MVSSIGRPALGIGVMGALVAALVMVLLLVSGSTETKPAEAHGWPTNGCSHAPDSGPWFNFHESCDYHDRCLYYGWSTKAGCDYNFYLQMRSYCLNTYPWSHPYRGACLYTAWIYYQAVKNLSWVCNIWRC